MTTTPCVPPCKLLYHRSQREKRTLELLEGQEGEQYLYEPTRDEVYTEAQIKAAIDQWLRSGQRVRKSVVESEAGQ